MTFPVTVAHNHWISMPDGVQLACRLWLPMPKKSLENFYPLSAAIEELSPGNQADSGESLKFPALLEALPYCKDIFTLERDIARHRMFAEMGFAVCRVDLRGTGNSGGICLGEYSEQELQDCENVISWLAGQPWCSKKVAMFGKSWAGFNGLQLAARNVKFLETVISLYSSDDRYNNSPQYFGGCRVADGIVAWSNKMHLNNAVPPNPKYCPDWKEKWKARLDEASEPWLTKWLQFKDHRSEFWKHGSIKYCYDKIKIPILVFGGLCDPYIDGAFNMARNLPANCRIMIGPWGHDWPDVAKPGPQINFMKMCRDWLQFHLNGNSGAKIDAWPRILLFVKDSHLPEPQTELFKGHWLQLNALNESNIKSLNIPMRYHHERSKSKDDLFATYLPSKSFQGFHCGSRMSKGDGKGLPGDQRVANGVSILLESKLFERDISICGHIEIEVVAKSDRTGMIAARLCCSNDDGSSTLISYGVQKVENSCFMIVKIRLKPTTYSVPRGKTVTLALSGAMFPMILPPTEHGHVIMRKNSVKLILPIIRDSGTAHNVVLPKPHYNLDTITKLTHKPASFSENFEVNETVQDFTKTRINHGADIEYPTFGLHYILDEKDYFQTFGDVRRTYVSADRTLWLLFHGINVEIHAKASLSQGAHLGGKVYVEQSLSVILDGSELFKKSWNCRLTG